MAFRIQKQKILFKGIETEEQYRDLVFVTKNNRPTQQFIVQEAIGAIVNGGYEDFKSAHAGLTKEELTVPLIVIQKQDIC